MSASSATDSTRCYENRPQALKDGSEGSMTPDTTKASISSWSSINANLSAHPAFRSISQANLNKFRGLSDLYALASRAKALNELVDWVTMSGRTYKIIRKHNEKKALVRNSCLPVIIEEQTHDEGEPMSPDNSPRPDASDAQFRGSQLDSQLQYHHDKRKQIPTTGNSGLSDDMESMIYSCKRVAHIR